MYNYLNNYKKYLSSLKTTINNVRLITVEELINFGCDVVTASCTTAPNFIYSTSYWSGSAGDSVAIWRISSTKNLDNRNYGDPFGVRPVVEVPVSEIIVTQKPYANGSLDEVGTVVTIGTEQFYVIGTEGDNVKLLSMYNLYVGNECTSSSSCTPYGEEATGKQDSEMIGRPPDNSYPRRGITAFSSDEQKGINYTDYNGSIVEEYVNNYNNYLIMKGVTPVEARLITRDELISLGCSDSSCSNAPSWVYATTYWSGSANDSVIVLRVNSVGAFVISYYNIDDVAGVRPVIVINKNLIDVNINILEFNVNGVSYQYEEGMTWEEWINSKYNIDEAETDGTYIYFNSENIGTNNTCINSSDLINNNLNYQIVFEQCAI